MQISNLIQTLSTFVFFGFAFIVYIQGNLYKKFSQRYVYKHNVRADKNFHKYEESWYFYVAWGGGLLWSAIYQTIFFNDIYNSIHSSDSVVSIIILLFLYEYFLYFWLHFLYLKPDNHFKLARTAVILGIVCAILTFIFTWIFLDNYQWYHFGSILLIVPSIFALLCIVDSQSFRTTIAKNDSSTLDTTLLIKKTKK